jgi:hypothetical protein
MQRRYIISGYVPPSYPGLFHSDPSRSRAVENNRSSRIHLQRLPLGLVRNLRRMLLHRYPDPFPARPCNGHIKKSRNRERKSRRMDVRGELQVPSFRTTRPAGGMVTYPRECLSGMEEGRVGTHGRGGRVAGFISLETEGEVTVGDSGPRG